MSIRYPFCIFRGDSPIAIRPYSEIRLDLFDLGLIRAYGVFDYLRTYRQQPFRLADYLNRFERSASLLGMELPTDKAALGNLVHELIARTSPVAAPGADFGVRFLLTGGPSADGFTRTAQPTLLVLIETITNPNPHDLEQGIKLLRCEYLRDLPEAKTTNYLNAVRLYPRMKAEGAAELLYIWQGSVLEASRANIFAFFGNTLVTPTAGILLGNTRRSVLELASGKFDIEERPLREEELALADELFITGSGRMLTPVVQVDSLTVGSGRPGKNTQVLIDAFEAVTGFAQLR